MKLTSHVWSKLFPQVGAKKLKRYSPQKVSGKSNGFFCNKARPKVITVLCLLRLDSVSGRSIDVSVRPKRECESCCEKCKYLQCFSLRRIQSIIGHSHYIMVYNSSSQSFFTFSCCKVESNCWKQLIWSELWFCKIHYSTVFHFLPLSVDDIFKKCWI